MDYLIRRYAVSVCGGVCTSSCPSMCFFPGWQYDDATENEWWNTTHTGTHTLTHSLLGYNVASAHPHSAAKSKSNILCSPHVAQAWLQPQWKLHITVTLSVCLCVCQYVCLSGLGYICLPLCLYLSVLVWLPGYEFTRLSASLLCIPFSVSPTVSLFICLCLSVCISIRLVVYTVCLSICQPLHFYMSACPHVSLFSAVCLISERSASVIKRNICSGISRQQH